MTATQSTPTLPPVADRRDLLPSEFVFVYGTLKRGFGNHYTLSKELFVGNAFTKCKYPLVVFDLLPFLLLRPHKGNHVFGEVYKVCRRTLTQILDNIEGHPQFYKRSRIAVTLESNKDQAVWAYFLNDYHVPEGIWQTLPALSAYKKQPLQS